MRAGLSEVVQVHGRGFIFVLGFLAASRGVSAETAAAKEDAVICSVTDQGIKSRTRLHSYPSYFFGAFPRKKWVSFRGQDSSWVVDLETGKRFQVPGEEDPVPLPDEKTMTTPREMRFYPIDDYQNGKRSEAKLTDPALAGVYQSIATLGKNRKGEATKNFRVLTDDGVASYRDYKVSYNSAGSPSVSPSGDVVKICEGMDLKLPKMSKDGELLAAVDESGKNPTTKIYRIGADRKCTEIFNFGFRTGKVDFSYDKQKIVFQAGASMGTRGSFRQRPGKGDFLNVYELDMKREKLRQLTFNPDNKNSYYPVYREDGTVIYLDQTIDAKGEESFDFVVADPARAMTVDFDAFVGTNQKNLCDLSPRSQAIAALGKEWIDICVAQRKSTLGEAVMTVSALTEKQCLQLVDRTWERLKKTSNPGELTQRTLKAACPSGKRTSHINIVGAQTSFEAAKSPHEITARKCAVCHGDSIPFHDVAKLKSTPSLTNPQRSLYEEMVRRLKTDNPSERMPKGGEMTEAELTTLMSALE